eukprot:Opistho-2@27049
MFHYKKDGSLDMRYASSKSAVSSGAFSSGASYMAPSMNSGYGGWSQGMPNQSGHHYKKDGTLDMRYASSKAASASPATSNSGYAYAGGYAASSQGQQGNLHYKKDGTLDMRYASSKASSGLTGQMQRVSIGSVPAGIPVTKQGRPDMRFKAARKYIQESRAPAGGRGPTTMPGSDVPLKKDGTPDMRYKAAQEYVRRQSTAGLEESEDPIRLRKEYWEGRARDDDFMELCQEARQQSVAMPQRPNLLPKTAEYREEFARFCGDGDSIGPTVAPAAPAATTTRTAPAPAASLRSVGVPESVQVVPFNSLTLEREMGRGSFGVVHMAKWNGTTVAVKVLHMAELTKKDKRDLEKELAVMAKLGNHPNLLSLVAYCSAPPALVTEYIQLGSLHYLLHLCEEDAIEAKMSDGRIKKRVLFGIANGLQQLHAVGVIHRDIKPHNVLIKDDFTAVIADFGLATLRGKTSCTLRSDKMGSTDGGGEDAETAAGIAGTAAYMAPELLADMSKAPEASSDIYSFGVLMNELVAEAEPYSEQYRNFHGRGPFAAVEWASRGNRPKIASEASASVAVIALIQKCWDAAPSSRPTASAIVDSLLDAAHLIHSCV